MVPLDSNKSVRVGLNIRWGTLYNFRFDANVPPASSNGNVILREFKVVTDILAPTIIPSNIECIKGDLNGDGLVNGDDITLLTKILINGALRYHKIVPAMCRCPLMEQSVTRILRLLSIVFSQVDVRKTYKRIMALAGIRLKGMAFPGTSILTYFGFPRQL